MQRIHRSTAAIVALAAICGLLASPAQACSSLGFEVGDNLAPKFETPMLNDDKTFKRYAVSEVRTHFGDQLSQPPLKFASSRGTTFACVDARGDGAELGTPGGDLAELVSGIMAWHKMEGKPFSKEQAKTMFDAFITKIARPGRPMYLHTDDNRLRKLFVNLTEKGMSPPPSKLPDVGPSKAADKAMWLEGLTHPDYQGCGHVRLMLNPEFTPYYSLKLSGDKVVDCTNVTEAADCISSKDVAAEVLSLFYNYWWFTKPGSPERQRTKLVVDLGPLVGKAVAIVGSTDNGGSCKYQHPLVFPNQAGSTLFVYHDAAVKEFREHAVRFGGLAALGKRTKLVKLWNEVAGMQLGATLTYLAPANDIGIFPVTVKTSGGGGRRMGK